MQPKRRIQGKSRFKLTEKTRLRIREEIGSRQVKEFAQEVGIPIGSLNNLLYSGRGKTISYGDHVKIFRVKPPDENQIRADGTFFRQMVRLFLYLSGSSKTDFCRDLASEFDRHVYTAFRVVNGLTETVDPILEMFVKEKLSATGTPEKGLEAAIERHERENPDPEERRYSYDEIKPHVEYLVKHLGPCATKLLGRGPGYYEAPPYPTVSEDVYKTIVDLFERTKRALTSGFEIEMEGIIDEVFDRETNGMVPYYKVRPLLDYLEGKGVALKELLGRSRTYYDNSPKFRRVPGKRYRDILSLFYVHFSGEELERIVQNSQLPIESITISELKKLLCLIYEGDVTHQVGVTSNQHDNTLPTKRLEHYISEISDSSLPHENIIFGVLGIMKENELVGAKNKLKYNSNDRHYAGELIYVEGKGEFGVVTTIQPRNINEGYISVKFYPSGKSAKLYGRIQST